MLTEPRGIAPDKYGEPDGRAKPILTTGGKAVMMLSSLGYARAKPIREANTGGKGVIQVTYHSRDNAQKVGFASKVENGHY